MWENTIEKEWGMTIKAAENCRHRKNCCWWMAQNMVPDIWSITRPINRRCGNFVVERLKLVKVPAINLTSAANNRLPRKDCLLGAMYVSLNIFAV